MKKLPILLLAIALSGCLKKAKDNVEKMHGVKWTGTYAVPLLDADLSLDDAFELVGDLVGIKPYSDGLIYIEFANKEISKMGYELVPLTSANKNTSDALTTAEKNTLTTSGSVTAIRDMSFTYLIPGNEIDSMYLSKGTLSVNFNHTYQHPTSALVKISGLKKNGSPVTFTYNLLAGNNNQTKTLDLTGCVWNMSNGGAGFNNVQCDVEVTYTNSGNGFSGSENFGLSVNITNPAFSKIFGYFGSDNIISKQDSVELSIFSSGLKTGSYNFTEPKFKIRVTNETGMPLLLKTKSLYGSKNGTNTNIAGYSSAKNINAAAGTNMPHKDSIFLDKNNSNFKTITDNQMHYVAYDIDVQSNPNGKTQRNFLSPESKVTVDVIAELPFWGTAVNVVLDDTSDFDLGLGDETKYIDWITLRMAVDNGIPTEIGVQGYFMDSTNKVLDSLFQPARNLITAAKVDGSGNAIANGVDQYDITVDRIKIEKIVKAKKLRIKAYLYTSKNSGISVPVKITKNQHLKLKMGIHTKLMVDEKF